MASLMANVSAANFTLNTSSSRHCLRSNSASVILNQTKWKPNKDGRFQRLTTCVRGKRNRPGRLLIRGNDCQTETGVLFPAPKMAKTIGVVYVFSTQYNYETCYFCKSDVCALVTANSSEEERVENCVLRGDWMIDATVDILQLCQNIQA